MNRLKDFASWAVNLSYEDIPEDVRQLTRLQVMNMVAAMVAGYRTEPDSRDRSNSGPCSTFKGKDVDPQTAYFDYTTDSIRHDYDDYLFMAHSGHSAVMAPLAVAQETGASSRDFLKAVAVANELEGRLGASTVLGPHNGQMWSFIHCTGAAAATALLKDANEEEFYHALALSLYNPVSPNPGGFMGGDSKYLTAAVPGSSGIRIAEQALAGDRGLEGIYEHEKGFLSNYAFVPLPEMMDGFGDSWVTRSVSFKPVPGCAYLQSPMQAFTEIREENRITGEEVDSVEVKGSLVTLLMESHADPFCGDPLTPINLTFSVTLSLALAMLEDDFGVDYLSKRYLAENSAAIREASERVKLKHDWDKTFTVLDGLNSALDFGPLVRDKGYFSILGGLRRMRKQHEGLSTGRELFRLVTSGNLGNLFGAFSSPLGWNEFEFGNAEFNDLRFNFCSEVTVQLESGETITRSLPGHRGRSEGDPSKQEPVVKEKLARETRAFFSSDSRSQELVDKMQTLPETDLSELFELLFQRERESASEPQPQ